MNQKQMEKTSDQTANEWQDKFIQSETVQFGQVDHYVKEGVNFLTCVLYLFVFWLVVTHVGWIVLKLYKAEWNIFPQIIRTMPHKNLMLFAAFVTGSASLISCFYKKLRSKQDDFSLLKLFPKNAVRKKHPSSSRGYHD